MENKTMFIAAAALFGLGMVGVAGNRKLLKVGIKNVKEISSWASAEAAAGKAAEAAGEAADVVVEVRQ